MSNFDISQKTGESSGESGLEQTVSGPDAPDGTKAEDWEDLDYDYELSDNVVEDLVQYSRSAQALNEPQLILTVLGYLTGLMEDPDHFISGVIIGTSSSGKTHMQKIVEKLFPESWMYQFTTGSDQTLAYDDEWDDALIASLDELNKISEELLEILKSVHGGDDEFTRRVVKDWRADDPDDRMMELTRRAKPYWFLYAQFDPDFELWNRLLKIPVHEGKAKNEAVLRLQFDHHNIEFSDSDFTYDFEFTEGTNALQDHIRNLPQQTSVKLPAGEDEFDGFDVIDTIASIFDTQRSETNRVGGMVANLVRASALLNHKNRRTTEIHIPNEGIKEVIVAEPEDVANILACREILLASTHELDRKKQSICSAIDAKGGTKKMATIPQIIEYLRQGNAAIIARSEVENNLAQLQEHYLVEKYEDASEDGKNMYRFLGWHNLGAIDLDEAFEQRFEGVVDPIKGQGFVESVKQLNEDIMPGASDFMDKPGVSSNSESTGQMKLAGGGTSIELEIHEEAVRAAMQSAVHGVTVEDMDESEPSLYAVCGAASLSHGSGDTKPSKDDLEGTVFDPINSIWNRPDVNADWVTDHKDAFNAVDETMTELHKKGVLRTHVHKQDSAGRPVEMEFEVMKKSEL